MDFGTRLDKSLQEGTIPPQYVSILKEFYPGYFKAAKEQGESDANLQKILSQYLDLVLEQIASPYFFEPYHERIRHPFDYYQFGIDFIRPLVDLKFSEILGFENVNTIVSHLDRNENVIIFANHQIEPDPQIISLLLENTYPNFAEKLIFVAGHRVISDPMAIPFSMGRNLLCIYSKKHIDNPPEQKEHKLLHNQRTMKRMGQLLSEGGKCIYVAPSGGRDRRNEKGEIAIAPFDPQSIELFWLMTQQAKHPTHFHTLALSTYNLLPPPHSIGGELGERRSSSCGPAHLAFGKEIDMMDFPGAEISDKKQRRQLRADYIQDIVNLDYKKFGYLQNT